jgi:hypothetical protein
LFKITRPVSFDTIKYYDIGRPDVLSVRIYENMFYWWILCKFNNIDDVWNDMFIGMDIVVPHENDLGSEMITLYAVSLVSNRFSTLFHINLVFLVNSETTP